MVDLSVKSSGESDALLFMTDATRPDVREDKYVLSRLSIGAVPVILAINKVDAVRKDAILSRISELSKIARFDEVFPISARTGENVEEMVSRLGELLPEGPRFYPSGMTTDQPESFLFGEIIREKAFLLLHDELPYSTAVVVDDIEDRPNGVTAIYASIYIERGSQKGIVIGKGGSMLKKIGSSARRELERRLGAKVFLDLRVKIKEKWTSDARSMSSLGYKKEA